VADDRRSELSDPARDAVRKKGNRDTARLVAIIVLVAVLVAFVVANSNPVTVHFVFFSASVGLIWVLLVTALLGGLVGRLLQWRMAKGRRAAAREARNQ